MSAQHTPGPEVSRVDREFSRGWIEENPALFAERVLNFVDAHPAEQWIRIVRTYNWYVTYTAIRKTPESAQVIDYEDITGVTTEVGPQTVTFHFCTEAAAKRFYKRAARALAMKKRSGGGTP